MGSGCWVFSDCVSLILSIPLMQNRNLQILSGTFLKLYADVYLVWNIIMPPSVAAMILFQWIHWQIIDVFSKKLINVYKQLLNSFLLLSFLLTFFKSIWIEYFNPFICTFTSYSHLFKMLVLNCLIFQFTPSQIL